MTIFFLSADRLINAGRESTNNQTPSNNLINIATVHQQEDKHTSSPAPLPPTKQPSPIGDNNIATPPHLPPPLIITTQAVTPPPVVDQSYDPMQMLRMRRSSSSLGKSPSPVNTRLPPTTDAALPPPPLPEQQSTNFDEGLFTSHPPPPDSPYSNAPPPSSPFRFPPVSDNTPERRNRNMPPSSPLNIRPSRMDLNGTAGGDPLHRFSPSPRTPKPANNFSGGPMGDFGSPMMMGLNNSVHDPLGDSFGSNEGPRNMGGFNDMRPPTPRGFSGAPSPRITLNSPMPPHSPIGVKIPMFQEFNKRGGGNHHSRGGGGFNSNNRGFPRGGSPRWMRPNNGPPRFQDGGGGPRNFRQNQRHRGGPRMRFR